MITTNRGRLAGIDLTPDERADVEDWLTTHRVDPHRTPLDALIEYDPVHDEWRIEQFGPRPWTPDAAGRPPTVFVRRRNLADLPWPDSFYAQLVDLTSAAGLDITDEQLTVLHDYLRGAP